MCLLDDVLLELVVDVDMNRAGVPTHCRCCACVRGRCDFESCEVTAARVAGTLSDPSTWVIESIHGQPSGQLLLVV